MCLFLHFHYHSIEAMFLEKMNINYLVVIYEYLIHKFEDMMSSSDRRRGGFYITVLGKMNISSYLWIVWYCINLRVWWALVMEEEMDYITIYSVGMINNIQCIVVTWATVVCLVYLPKAWGCRPEEWGCIYQVNHECPCYNYYVPLNYRLQTHVCNK